MKIWKGNKNVIILHYWGNEDDKVSKKIVSDVLKNKVNTKIKPNEKNVGDLSKNFKYSTMIRNICKLKGKRYYLDSLSSKCLKGNNIRRRSGTFEYKIFWWRKSV